MRKWVGKIHILDKGLSKFFYSRIKFSRAPFTKAMVKSESAIFVFPTPTNVTWNSNGKFLSPSVIKYFLLLGV